VGLRILLADGSVTVQNTGKKILNAAGYDVLTVSNGLAAARQIAERHPDIVLLDVFLPGQSGTDLCERTKENPETARTPVLLTVGQMEPFRLEEGNKVRADGLIVKPFETKSLIIAVERVAPPLHLPKPEPPKNILTQSLSSPLPRAVPGSGPRIEDKTPGEPRPAVSSCNPAEGELCDVCGHVNPTHMFACQQCDVPLPSSLNSYKSLPLAWQT